MIWRLSFLQIAGHGRLIPRHVGINFVRPGGNAAFDTLEVFEALFTQEAQRLERTHAGLAVEAIMLVRVELGEPLLDLAQRQQRHAFDVGDFVFVRLAHINDLDAKLRIVERLLHVLHRDFVGIDGRVYWFGCDAAEHFVIAQFLDGWMFAADGALRVAAEFQFAELHVERVEQQQSPDERTALADGELQNFRRLDAADNAGQHAEHPAFRAAWHHAGRRRFGIKTAVTRPAEMRRKHAGLALETENRAVNIGFLEQHARVVREIARREIVRAVHDDVVGPDEVEGVFGRDAGVVDDDLAIRIDARDGFLGGLRLGPAHVGVRVQNLALEIGIIHGVEIHYSYLSYPGGGEVHGDGRAEAARADAQDAGALDFLLACQTDFRQNQVPRVTADFIIVQFHKSS